MPAGDGDGGVPLPGSVSFPAFVHSLDRRAHGWVVRGHLEGWKRGSSVGGCVLSLALIRLSRRSMSCVAGALSHARIWTIDPLQCRVCWLAGR